MYGRYFSSSTTGFLENTCLTHFIFDGVFFIKRESLSLMPATFLKFGPCTWYFLKKNWEELCLEHIGRLFLIPERRWHLLYQCHRWKHQGNVWNMFKVKIKDIIDVDLVSSSGVTLITFYTFFWCFHCWLWTLKNNGNSKKDKVKYFRWIKRLLGIFTKIVNS